MKRIMKTVPPREFLNWYRNRITEPKIWDDLKSNLQSPPVEFDYSKQELRTYLFDEQGSICCYCNQNILNNHKSKIEHFLPRHDKKYVKEIFNYYNLFLSCSGKADKEKDVKFHCDTLKNGSVITMNPSKKKYLNDLIYDEFGRIYSSTVVGKEAIDKLGLDNFILTDLRGEIISDIIFNEQAEYKRSSEYRQLFFKAYRLPLEFKYQILQVLKSKMNRTDYFITASFEAFQNLKNNLRVGFKILTNLDIYKSSPKYKSM